MLMTDVESGLCETEKSYKMVSNERGANLYWLRLPHGVIYFFDVDLYLAYETERVSRMTVILTCPG